MLRSCKEFTGYAIQAKDGELGKVKDLLFDDQKWVVRYLVADTGRWLPGRKVLISPISVLDIDWNSRRVVLSLTQEDLERSPPLEEDAPVSLQHERSYLDFLGYAYYWGAAGLWGDDPYPAALSGPTERENRPDSDHHLRSMNEVRGYAICGSDGDLGSVHDFVIDDESWVLRYLAADLGRWLPGRKVLIAPVWARRVNWASREVAFDLSRHQIDQSPPYDPDAPVNREYEMRLYDYYGRPQYWNP
jgi:uncharacterized protein YrrD